MKPASKLHAVLDWVGVTTRIPGAWCGSLLPVPCPSQLAEICSLRKRDMKWREESEEELQDWERDGDKRGGGEQDWLKGQSIWQGEGLVLVLGVFFISFPQLQFQNWDFPNGTGPSGGWQTPQKLQAIEKQAHTGSLESREQSFQITGFQDLDPSRAQSRTKLWWEKQEIWESGMDSGLWPVP